MEFLTFDLLVPVFLGITTVSLALYTVWLGQRSAAQQKAMELRIASLEADLKALTNGAVGVGRKLLTVEQRVLETEKRTQELSLSDPVKVSYNEAARLLELGADVDDLIANCGLSRPEAELVAALHRQRSAA